MININHVRVGDKIKVINNRYDRHYNITFKNKVYVIREIDDRGNVFLKDPDWFLIIPSDYNNIVAVKRRIII